MRMGDLARAWTLAVGCLVAAPAWAEPASTGSVRLQDGRVLQGVVSEIQPGSHVTLVGADGSSVTVPWSQVTEVLRGAAVSEPPAARPLETTAASGAALGKSQAVVPDGEARLHFSSDRDGTVIHEVEGHSRSIGYVRGRSAVMYGANWRPLCEAPCEVRVPLGYREFVVTAPNSPTAAHALTVRGDSLKMHARMGSGAAQAGGSTLAVLGLTSVLVGAAFLPVGYALDRSVWTTTGWALLIGGGVATAGGVALLATNASELEVTQARERQARSAPIRAPMVTWSGSF